MDLCTGYHAQFRDGEHALEFYEEKHGQRYWRCTDCGDLIMEYHDVGSGG